MYRRTGRGRLLLLAFLALSLVVITLDYRAGGDGPLENAKDISTTIVAPIQRGMTAVFRPVGDFFSSLGDISSLRSENTELRGRLDEIEGDLGEAGAVKSENERLRGLLELDESWITMERVTASVIATSPANYRWAVTIDKGSNDGVREKMAVIAPEGLVGKIIRAGTRSSIVLLMIDPQAAARARIEGKGFTGAVIGNGGDEPLSLNFIDPEADVDEGDEVVTSGYDLGIFPPSIPIGEVVEATGEGAQLDQDIRIEPWVDFNSLDFVQVLMESGPDLPDRNDDKGRQDEDRT